MTAQRKRAFIIMDLEDFDGDASDLADHIDAVVPERLDLTVYTSLEDLLHDRAAGVDMFDRQVAPIRKPPWLRR